jgi:DNA-binding NtrC family response regulator
MPIFDEQGELRFFVELLKPVNIASIQVSGAPMVGSAPAFNEMLELIARVAPCEAAVLLQGESGCGKELAAAAVHAASTRADRPLVTLECSGLTETLFESELFGHVKGAFTGANYNKPGLVESAHGGTLFLDEVGDIPLPLQVKLLRLIETGAYRPVGGTEMKHADFRLVCATHKDIEALVDAGEFRQDLYFRINVFPIHVPSLAERIEDLPLIARTILEDVAGDRQYHLTESATAVLKAHHYRGNIRELRNLLSRAVVLADTNVLDRRIIERCLSTPRARTAEGDSLRAVEQRHLAELLHRFSGDKQRVADAAGISLRSLYRKLGRATETPAGS